MKYFYDTEFIENGETIGLISIGIVTEDGRELYMETPLAEFYVKCPLHCTNNWVRNNVIPNLIGPRGGVVYPKKEMQSKIIEFIDLTLYGKPEFWGYYSAYDHVALCQLFGTMMDLPKGWPMYTRDIKQLCDSLGNPKLPEQGKGEHHALADARWNKQAYDFLMSLK